MSFKSNDSQQITLNDALFGLTDREKRMLEKSWAKPFAEKIFPKIDESLFACLYSDKASRPNTPVNVCAGALIIKELLNLTDDEMVESLAFDVRFQYALHTTSFEEQPLSDKTLSRFRKRCYTYELATGIDLIYETITGLSGEMAKIMKINGQIQRMDSLMVASNIKRLSRMELLYTCVSDLVVYLHKNNEDDKLEGLEHYYNPDDYNNVIYRQRKEDYDQRLQTILSDADSLIKKCNGGYDDVPEYQLLVRAFSEQVVREDDALRLKTKEDGSMNSSMLQNPSDPEATYREKAGKQHRGYVVNVTGRNTLVTDGAYSSEANRQLADDKNIDLVTTYLLGRDVRDICAEFQFSEDGTRILLCPAGNQPKSSSIVKSTGKVRASFPKNKCENCPYKDQCRPKTSNKTSAVYISKGSHERAKAQRFTGTWQFKFLSKVRNGVETIPSTLRRKYNIDTTPVRGRIRMKHLFGFKIGALNFRKLLKYLGSLEKCALNPEIA